ncbi:MAG: hypothetical protein SV253_06815 [Halobacteria archaeon]|nr:hypothetical protein [Halobacteria archaeon]
MSLSVLIKSSDVFNSTAVLGVPSLLGEIVVPGTLRSFGVPSMVLATLLYFFTTQNRNINRWEGATLLLLYVVFLGNILGLL